MRDLNQKRKCSRFRIHLSSAILLVLVAGGILWLNCRYGFQEEGGIPGIAGYSPEGPHPFSDLFVRFGWPQVFYEEVLYGPTLDISALGVDLLVGLSLLANVAIACEWIIRRRVAGHRDEPPPEEK